MEEGRVEEWSDTRGKTQNSTQKKSYKGTADDPDSRLFVDRKESRLTVIFILYSFFGGGGKIFNYHQFTLLSHKESVKRERERKKTRVNYGL